MGRTMALQEAATGTAPQTAVHGPGFYAWIVSILVHVLILAGLWFVHFPQDRGRTTATVVPLAAVSKVQKLTQSAAVVPKPRVKSPSQSFSLDTNVSKSPPTTRLDGDRLRVEASPAGSAYRADSRSYIPVVEADSPALAGRVGFFDSYTQHRKICYVVDCSGSMRGSFKRVQDRLKQSIADLQPDHYFHIIFFGDGRLTESPGGSLRRASERNKSAAFDFIESLRPAGTTNALAALERALRIRDIDGNAPSVVYFLTDGFDLDGKGSALFSTRIDEMLKGLAPATQINTIGFWPQEDDRSALEAIAAQSGGRCVLITGHEDPATLRQ